MHDLGEFIREQRRVARLSLRKLSDMAGICNPYLSQIERGLRKPSAEILQQIAKALRISAETLYVRAGILEERTGEHDLVGEILRDPSITEAQKQALIQVYQSFQHENDDVPSRRVTTHGALPANRRAGPTGRVSPRCAHPGHPVAAHLPAGAAGLRRRWGHERVRARALGRPRPCRTRRATCTPAPRGPACRRWSTVEPGFRVHHVVGGPDRDVDKDDLPDARRRLHRGCASSGSARGDRARRSSMPTTGCPASPATRSSTSSSCRSSPRSTRWRASRRRTSSTNRMRRARAESDVIGCSDVILASNTEERGAARASLRRGARAHRDRAARRRPRLLLPGQPPRRPCRAGPGRGRRTRCCSSSAASSRSKGLDVAVRALAALDEPHAVLARGRRAERARRRRTSSSGCATLIADLGLDGRACASSTRSPIICSRATTAPPTCVSCPAGPSRSGSSRSRRPRAARRWWRPQ